MKGQFLFSKGIKEVESNICALLLDSLNLLQKSDTMFNKPHILSLFCNSFNKFNNTQALANVSLQRER